MRVCTKCGASKPFSGFHNNKSKKDGITNECKVCRAKRTLLYRKKHRNEIRERKKRDYRKNPDAWHSAKLRQMYGLTAQEYIQMFESQNGKCLICKQAEMHRRRLSVDHEHRTKKVRGLLCVKCNAVLGQVGDSPALLRTAANYLEGKIG